MIADMTPDWRGEVIVSERLITRPMEETEEQWRERVKAGLPIPMLSYTVVKTMTKKEIDNANRGQ